MKGRRVVVTGAGIVSPFGAGMEIFRENLMNGKSAARLIDSFDVSELPTKFFAEVPLKGDALDSLIDNQKSLKTMSRSAKFAMIAADEAVRDSGLNFENINPFRTGTSFGSGGLGNWDLDYLLKLTSIFAETEKNEGYTADAFGKIWVNIMNEMHPLSPLKALPNISTAQIAIKYNAKGNCQTITTACTSSAQAIGEAYRQIKYGICDVMLTGGSDSMTNPNGLVAFSMLGVLSKNNPEYKTALRPFDKRRDGFMIGEGGAVIVLEEYEHCRKRGGNIYAEIAGFASTNDSYRLTDEPPDAGGSIAAMKIALNDAEMNGSSVDYINAHGTGTKMNDKNETLAIKTVFGKDAYKIPVSSNKSMIGHLVAAAGCVEFTATLLTIKNQIIPPTINYEVKDPECDLDYVPNTACEAVVNTAQSNSFGFGGQNACLILKKV